MPHLGNIKAPHEQNRSEPLPYTWGTFVGQAYNLLLQKVQRHQMQHENYNILYKVLSPNYGKTRKNHQVR